MRPLSQKEKRTVRLGAIVLGAYLILFGGLQVWNAAARRYSEYQQLLAESRSLRTKVSLYQSKSELIQKLMKGFNMDPARLERPTVVARASAAIQTAALGGGVQIGAVHESPGRPSSKELGSIQLEAAGPVPALLKFVQQTQSLGYPLIIDSFQIGSEPSRPGLVKLNLTIVILDFDQWKQEKSHA
ncbi:MAG TPA: hypothetical protein VKY92_16505 [Verrucomicrobiae bacterium]|nr:hypothetical protein [Verrucomicrobiae bacterium]